MKLAARITGGILAVAIVVGIVWGIIGALVYWAWNATMPSLFGLPNIQLWQAIALAVLFHILFKSTQTNNNSKG